MHVIYLKYGIYNHGVSCVDRLKERGISRNRAVFRGLRPGRLPGATVAMGWQFPVYSFIGGIDARYLVCPRQLID